MMHQPGQVMLNGRLLPAAEARVSVLADGFMFGAGVFETLRVSQGRPEFWAEHVERLSHGAAELGLPLPATFAGLRDTAMALIGAEQLTDAVLKIVVFQDLDGGGELMTWRPNLYTKARYDAGFAVMTSEGAPTAARLCALKTLNYLGHSLAMKTARAGGFDEVIHVADGLVREGAAGNVFAVKQGRVITPRVESGLLPGIIRARLLSQCEQEVVEGDLSVEQLTQADEVFITNSVLGVMPVCSINRIPCRRNGSAERFRVLVQSLAGNG